MPNHKENSSRQESLDQAPEMQATPREYYIANHKLLRVAYLHIGGLYGLYLCCTSAKWVTNLLNYIIYMAGSWGMTAGAEYLWLRRSYNAKRPLQILLMIFQTMSGHGSIIQWISDMRLHHYYRDTDADPFNSKRGFLYSHFGWQVTRRHMDAVERGKNLDLTDVNDNPVLQFQKQYYLFLSSVLVFILPSFIPVYFWQETLNNAYHVCLFRFLVGFYTTFAASGAGTRIKPTGKSALGTYEYYIFEREFPLQYRSSDLFQSPLSTKLNDFFARIGWAYDLNDRSKTDVGTKQSKKGWSWHDEDDMEENHNNFIGF